MRPIYRILLDDDGGSDGYISEYFRTLKEAKQHARGICHLYPDDIEIDRLELYNLPRYELALAILNGRYIDNQRTVATIKSTLVSEE